MMTGFSQKAATLFLFFSWPLYFSGQNLVLNCDFDRYTVCPDNHGQFDRAYQWYVPTAGTSDLCHECSSQTVGIPNNMWGSQEPYSGSGYGHIISFYNFASPQYREYMQTRLACPLRAGEEYAVSFYVSNSDNSGFGIDGMGLHFSMDSILADNNIAIDIDGWPEITNVPGSVINDKDGWVKISGNYTAQGGEQFITIGNFLKDEDLAIEDYPGNSSNYASYYVSHISVVPRTSWLDLGNDTTTCFGEPVTVDARLGCAASCLWNDGDTSSVKTLTAPGLYSVSAGFGCSNATDQILFEWYPEPVIPIPGDTFICPGGSVLLDGGKDFTSYLWQDNSIEEYYVASSPGIVWCEVMDENGCTKRDSAIISGLPEPFLELGPDFELCYDVVAVLDAWNEGISASYLWQDNSTEQFYTVVSPGRYSVLVTNPCGSVRDSVYISYKDCEALIWVPNAFTPDNNGYNDVFMAKGANLASFRMYIYNRWGELVFETSDIDTGWDGKWSGEPCPSDVYVWMVVYEALQEKGKAAFTKKGNVYLLR
jgi:gliding motility-associated-like protein